MMSGITKVFNKSAKRNFHQRESHDDDKIATIYYDILEQEGEILTRRSRGQVTRDPFLCIVYGQRLPRLVTFVSVLEKFIYYIICGL